MDFNNPLVILDRNSVPERHPHNPKKTGQYKAKRKQDTVPFQSLKYSPAGAEFEGSPQRWAHTKESVAPLSF